MGRSATAAAHPNLALVKYWGQADPALNLPANGSVSVNLSGATTTTTVTFDAALSEDRVELNGRDADPVTTARVVAHLDRVRALAGTTFRAWVTSRNDFPTAAGVASSSSAFASLSLAASRALGLDLDRRQLSILARKGSGSACRSIPDGFAEWVAGDDDESSYAFSLAAQEYWDLRIVTVAWPQARKVVPSLVGHRAAPTSPFYAARLATVACTLHEVREALLARDFDALGMAVEREAASLHAVAMTSRVEDAPWLSGIYYPAPETVGLIQAVQRWRREGLPVYATLDAGSSVHLLCLPEDLIAVKEATGAVCGDASCRTIVSRPGRGAWLLNATAGAEGPGG
jgi:diphosphomevalonate decarboxylase